MAILAVAIGDAWQVMRWLRPTAPPQVNSALRQRLRQAEDKLTAEALPAAPDQPGSAPCLVIPVRAGVGPRPSDSPKNPIRDCLQLAPGGPPENAIELDLRTDTLIFVQTDMYLPGDPPIGFTRVIEPLVRWNRRFQIFLQNEYDVFPWGDRFPYTYLKLELADRRNLFFQRISNGTGYADAVYKHEVRGSPFYRALAGWNGNGWDVDLADGRTLVFPDSYHSTRPPEGALVGLMARSGASLSLKRGPNGNLRSVRSGDGRRMKLGYQGPLIASLEDSAGEKASYSYDSGPLLAASKNSAGEELSYSYNQKGELTAVWDAKRKEAVFDAHYGRMGALASLWTGGGPVFRFSYRIDSTGSSAEVEVKEKGFGDWSVLMGPCTANGYIYHVRSRR